MTKFEGSNPQQSSAVVDSCFNSPAEADSRNLLHEEAQRLVDKGYHLVELKQFSKQPLGNEWNQVHQRVDVINPRATGYGVPLKTNAICSLDPDNEELARVGFDALGFSITFDELMDAGVRTCSTRPGSGGRSAFSSNEMLRWIKFRTHKTGTILELRANSNNLQDCLPGTVYGANQAGQLYTQSYYATKRLDDVASVPDEFLSWWIRLSTDLSSLREAQETFYTAIADYLGLSLVELGGYLDVSDGKKMAYNVSGISAEFNRTHQVEPFLSSHGYEKHGERYSAPNATGAPGIRLIPEKDDLWQSDHASDPLSGTFDAWSCFVVLEHRGDLDAAVDAYAQQKRLEVLQDFVCLEGGLKRYEMGDRPKATKFVVQGLIAEGITVLASYPGGGKTSAMLALAAQVSGAYKADIELQPLDIIKHRHVIYFTEHPEQVELILNGMIMKDWADASLVKDRIHIINARRKPHDALAELSEEFRNGRYLNRVARNGIEIDVTPWVIFDTTSAMIDLENENSNSDWSAAISALKEAYKDIPLTLIAHTSKAGKNASNASSLTTRGGSALEGDANQIMFLTVEEKYRYIDIKESKHRFTPSAHSLAIWSEVVEMQVVNEFEELVEESVVVCQLEPVDLKDRENRKAAEESEKLSSAIDKYKYKIANAVSEASEDRKLLSKAQFNKLVEGMAIKDFTKSKKAAALATAVLKSRPLMEILKDSKDHELLKGAGYVGAPQAHSYVVTSYLLDDVCGERRPDDPFY